MQRILTINDLSGWGHTSLMVAIPIFYKLGFQVATLPSCILSTNTDYPDYQMQDMTELMSRSIEHWQGLGVMFDALYTGFLAGASQQEQVIKVIDTLLAKEAMVLIDPVMGDKGRLYSCYDHNMVEAMRRLIARATIITPNLTEACLLLDMPYNPHASREELLLYAEQLQKMGAENVVITSSPTGNEETTGLAILMSEGRWLFREYEYVPAEYPGTGDVFSTIVAGCTLRGDELPVAIDRAAGFIGKALRISLEAGGDIRDGIALELALQNIDI